MAIDIMASLSAGAVFGVALTVSRVYLPSVIINQMRLKDFHMLEVFLTASASSALIVLLFERSNIATPTVRSNSTLNRFGMYDGNIIGGALLGLGMALTGACPGTVLPQLAHGVESARATAVGGLLGGLVYAKWPDVLRRSGSLSSQHRKRNQAVESAKTSESGPLTIAKKFNLSASTVWLAFEVVVLAIATISVVTLPGKTEALIPTVAGGLLVAVAQATSILLTSTPLGVSAAYEQAGRLIWRNVLGDKNVQPPSTNPPKSLIFAIGILLGSVAAGPFMPALSSNALVPVPTLQALVGGFVLTFGARIAGGCTSGHGLSGLSSLSYSSLLTTAAMFGSGILTQTVITHM